MKDFDLNPEQISKPEISIVQQQQKEYKFIGYIRRRKGQTLFSFNPDTLELKEVPIEKKEAELDIINRTERSSKRASYDPKVIYFFALNIKNAFRKLKKAGITGFYIKET